MSLFFVLGARAAAPAVVAQLAGPGVFQPGVGEVEGAGAEPGAIIDAVAGVIAGSTGIARLAAALPIPIAPAGVEGEASTGVAGRPAYGYDAAAPPAYV
jgi:hypothetical protein